MQYTLIAVSIALAAMVGCVVAQEYPPAQPYGSAPKSPEPYYAPVPPKYAFDYTVQDHYTGVDFGHNEQRDGYLTNGQYFVQLPDGRLQKVVYSVDDGTGYLADVQYQGEAQFPEEKYPPPAPASYP